VRKQERNDMTIINCDMGEGFGIPNAVVIATAARKAAAPYLSAA
jgi:cell division GTPase FtsZ